jgi:hypothetical protein
MSSPNYPFANFNSSAAATSQLMHISGQKFIGVVSTSVLNSTALTFSIALSQNATQMMTVKNSSGGTFSMNTTFTNSYYGFSSSESQLFEGAKFIQVTGSTLEVAGTNIALVLIPRPFS